MKIKENSNLKQKKNHAYDVIQFKTSFPKKIMIILIVRQLEYQKGHHDSKTYNILISQVKRTL